MEILRFLPFFAAALAALIGAYFYLRNRSRLRQWKSAVGTVVGSQSMYSGGTTRHAPRVQFSTSDGQAVTFVSQYGELITPVVGSTATVLYDPETPTRAELKFYIRSQHAPLVCAICAVVFSIGGLAVVFR
jgi:hypothetical protein